MLQIDFLTELFTKAKQNGIHTALDTCGILFDPDHTEKVEKLMAVTDLVLLDIKHMFDEEHKKLTGHSNARVFAFAEYLKKIGKPVWIRHVVVPGITFQREELLALGRYLKTLTNMEKLEVLPYHSMGKVKYDSLGIEYPCWAPRSFPKRKQPRRKRSSVKAWRNKSAFLFILLSFSL